MDCFILSKKEQLANDPAASLPPSFRIFEVSELEKATRGYRPSRKIVDGEFGGFYKGIIKKSDAKQRVMVQQIQGTILEAKSHEEWVREVAIHAAIDHPNLIKVVGYCAPLRHGIRRYLVQEFARNGTVQDHLFNPSRQPLPWERRLTIAQAAARAMAYLHQGIKGHNEILFSCFKSSIVFLDENFNAKVADYATARLGPFPGVFVETKRQCSLAYGQLEYYMGYAAPEFFTNHKLTSMNNVWSYGIFVFQLITGRRPFDRNLPRQEQNLVNWVKTCLANTKLCEQILDPRLQGRVCIQSAMGLAAVANLCLEEDPNLRPKMGEVAVMVSRIVEAAIDQNDS
ncbi:hypothetical protein UlMin_025942 [Ulmus minor]